MDIEVCKKENGVLLSLMDRVDSFNYDETTRQIRSKVSPKRNKVIAIDLSKVQFLSLKAIRFLHQMAKEAKENGGSLALVGVSEKLKRQIDIYVSLDPFVVYKSIKDWEETVTCS
ncbi:MAG: anti-sigma factor antagonist [Bdellovibrio sp.]|nr:MAG: anti-sigma factor antagonist [Bdellovibrio sp.]